MLALYSPNPAFSRIGYRWGPVIGTLRNPIPPDPASSGPRIASPPNTTAQAQPGKYHIPHRPAHPRTNPPPIQTQATDAMALTKHAYQHNSSDLPRANTWGVMRGQACAALLIGDVVA